VRALGAWEREGVAAFRLLVLFAAGVLINTAQSSMPDGGVGAIRQLWSREGGATRALRDEAGFLS
jgi:hypothetical protein